jgi:hypothetical protein
MLQDLELAASPALLCQLFAHSLTKFNPGDFAFIVTPMNSFRFRRENTALCKFPTFKLFSSYHPCPGGAIGLPRHSCSRATAYSRSIRSALHGQVELLALHDLRPVDVEEVGVEDGLD